MTLLLIDTAVREYETILSAAKPTVTTVLFDRAVDTFATLKDKIVTGLNGAQAAVVGIVQHGSAERPIYQMLETQATPATVTDAQTSDPTLQTWSELIDFYSFLKSHGATTVDLISCSLYANEGWVYVLQQLESQLQLNFRASINDTGNVASGGDWIQESDGVNIQDIYFTEDISAYTQLLFVLAYGFQMKPIVIAPGTTNGSFVLKGGNNSAPMITATSFPDAMVVRGAVKGNVVFNWGDVTYGNTNSVVSTNSGIVSIATHLYASSYMKSDGSVFAWGTAGTGGDGASGAIASSGSPVVAITPSAITNTATAAPGFSALRANGSVYYWGSTNATTGMIAVANSGSPVTQIAGTSSVLGLSLACAFAALREDGSVSSWGNTSNGGNNVQAQIANSGSPVVALAASAAAFAALRSDGTAYVWGNSLYGASATPFVVSNSGSPIIALTANGYSFAALRADGSVTAWGSSTQGGSNAQAALANSGSKVVTIARTETAYAALRENGSVYAWGNSVSGGSNDIASLANSGSPVVGLAGTGTAFCALRANGTVYAWGNASNGGNNTNASVAHSGSPVVSLFTNYTNFAAIRADGSVYSWGINGNTMQPNASSGSPVVGISSSQNSFCALRANGSIFAWGSTTNGGSNTTAQQAGSSGIIAVVGSQFGFNALRSTNPTPASASQALTNDLFGNYIAWTTDSTDTVTISCRSAINGAAGATQTQAMIDYIRTMQDRVNGPKHTISSSQLTAFKNTLISGASNLAITLPIDQYFPTISARNTNAFLEISDFVTDNSKYICIELPYNIPTTILENGTTVKTLFFDGTNVRDGATGSSPIISAGSTVTLGTKTLNSVAIGSLVGYGGPPILPITPIPRPSRPTVRNSNIEYYWDTTDPYTTCFTLTLSGGPSPIVVNLGPNDRYYMFSGLTIGTTYTLSLVATNSVGSSSTAVFEPAQASNPPSAAQAVTFTKVGSDAVRVQLTAPADINGSPIQGYMLYDLVDNRASVNKRFSIDPWKTEHVQTGIVPGTYTWVVAACNSSGYGPAVVDTQTMTFP